MDDFQISDPSARYEMTGNQPRPVVATVARNGRGKVAVSGPHPEAPAGWWRDSDRPGDQPGPQPAVRSPALALWDLTACDFGP